MRCVILSACPVSPELKRLLRPDDFIIACDAGYRNCAPLGCKPNIILGDFDTAPCPVQQNDDIIVLPHVKERAICAKANPCLYRLFHHARRRQQLVTHGIIVQRSQHIASPFRTSGLS